MAKFDLEWLGVFVAIYETRSVSRAAEQLDIAQASASIVLNKLRRHFDDQLFSRTTRGMEPTPDAQNIYPELKAALVHIEKARGVHSHFSPADSMRKFSVCMTDISEIVLLPRLINHLRRAAPQVGIDVEEISGESQQRLELGAVDLAVGFTPGLDAGFFQRALFEQSFVCLAAINHPRIQGKLSRRAFVGESHIVVTPSGTGHSIVEKMLARHRVERRVALRVPSFLGVARIVADTELLVIVPRVLGETLALQVPVQVLDPPITLPAFKVKLHWHQRFHADAGNVWLRQTMSELFSS